MEQLLVSTAIDSSLDKFDFDSIAGANVFVDERFLECTDKKYVVGSVRQRVLQAGCRLVDKSDDSDVVVELHCGAVGTDRSEGFVGTPAISMPGPVPIQLPEIKLLSQTSQYGTAKIGIVAYDAKTRQALAAGGLSRARSENSHWTILGVVPYSSGTLREEVALTRRLGPSDHRIFLSDAAPRFPSTQMSALPAQFIDTGFPPTSGQPTNVVENPSTIPQWPGSNSLPDRQPIFP